MSKKTTAHWWRTHFGDGPGGRPASQVEAQIDGVERFLSLEPRSRVLDLACGSGRQTLEIARRGHRVLGLDSSEGALSEARHAARAEKLNVHFLQADTRNIPYRNDFDAVVVLFGSFGYLPGDRDDAKVLESVHKALKPGGKLLLDLLNKEWLMRHFEPHIWEPGEDGKGAVVLDQIAFNFESGRLDNRRTIVAADGTRTPSHVSIRIYTLSEIKALLSSAGLVYRQSFGGFDGAAYGMDTQRLIVLAEKPAHAPKKVKKDDGLEKAIRIKGRR